MCGPLRLLVGIWFQVYFTALTGLLFTFPSRYLFTIDHNRYLALAVSTAGFLRAIHVSKYSRMEIRDISFSHTGLSPSRVKLPSLLC